MQLESTDTRTHPCTHARTDARTYLALGCRGRGRAVRSDPRATATAETVLGAGVDEVKTRAGCLLEGAKQAQHRALPGGLVAAGGRRVGRALGEPGAHPAAAHERDHRRTPEQ
jgi:hypothetical protein